VAVAVGDIRFESFVRLAERYFGRIPAQRPPEPVRTVEPPQTGERRALVRYPDPAIQPRCLVGFHRPALGHDDFYALDVLVGLLDGGATARLPRAFIETGLAVQAFAANPDSAFPDLFFFGLTPAEGHTTKELEGVLERELERLKTEPPTEAELQKVRHQNEAQFLRQLASLSGLADTLSSYEVMRSWRYIETYPERLAEVNASDIQRVAAHYFRPENRTVVTLEPAREDGQ
jgi:predicted Zn-dependent peptidase